MEDNSLVQAIARTSSLVYIWYISDKDQVPAKVIGKIVEITRRKCLQGQEDREIL